MTATTRLRMSEYSKRKPPCHRTTPQPCCCSKDQPFFRSKVRGIRDRSTVLLLEVPHEGHQRIDAFFGKRVVDRRAHPADRSVARESIQAGRRGFPDEQLLEI